MGIKTRIAILAVCGLVFVARANAQQQGMKALSESIVTAIQAQELGWGLQHSLIREDEFVHRWGNRYERATISITRLGSVGEATTKLDATPQMISSGAPAQRRTDIGDDALVYSRYGPTGGAVIYFRKGAIVASVTGPSEDIAIRFARLVATKIA